MPTGGTLTISVQNVKISVGGPASLKPVKYVKISIRDNGIGIPRENLSKIFDPYFSAKRFGSQPGIGLGLSISYAIIKRHNGHIGVDSELGKGTTFTIYLPTADHHTETRAAANDEPLPEKKDIRLMGDDAA